MSGMHEIADMKPLSHQMHENLLTGCFLGLLFLGAATAAFTGI